MFAKFKRLVRKGLIEMVIFEQRLESIKEMNHVYKWEEEFY